MVRFFDQELRARKTWCEGTHRICTPEQTLNRYRPLMQRAGITRIANVTGLDCIGLPVFMAVRPNSRSLACSQGKGIDADTAKASALMEALESWHDETVELPIRFESYAELRMRAHVVDIFKLPQCRGPAIPGVVPLMWVEGYDLIQQRSTWVPFDTVTGNSVRPAHHQPAFPMTSNGLASGNHLLEAMSHALCEVIERDANALWTLLHETELMATQVDVTTIQEPSIRALLDLLDRAAVEIAIWDITSDVGIPTYSATIFDREIRPRWHALGAFSGDGTHVDPTIALSRAVTEAIQSRLTLISGSRDDLKWSDYSQRSNPDDLLALANAVRKRPATRPFRTKSPFAVGETLEEDLANILRRLERVGIDSVVVVDLSKSDVQVPVVKVIVPGLEGVVTGGYVPGVRAKERMAQLEARRKAESSR